MKLIIAILVCVICHTGCGGGKSSARVSVEDSEDSRELSFRATIVWDIAKDIEKKKLKTWLSRSCNESSGWCTSEYEMPTTIKETLKDYASSVKLVYTIGKPLASEPRHISDMNKKWVIHEELDYYTICTMVKIVIEYKDDDATSGLDWLQAFRQATIEASRIRVSAAPANTKSGKNYPKFILFLKDCPLQPSSNQAMVQVWYKK